MPTGMRYQESWAISVEGDEGTVIGDRRNRIDEITIIKTPNFLTKSEPLPTLMYKPSIIRLTGSQNKMEALTSSSMTVDWNQFLEYNHQKR